MKKTKLEWALEHSRLGFAVHPLHWVSQDGFCSCGLRADEKHRSAGKHPRLNAWQDKATTAEDQIREWWILWPDANIGIVTGEKSGIIVLDIDPRNGGDEMLQRLLEKHGPLPETYTVCTGGGGTHYYFKYPGGD